ncbi:MAG: hypothetical protein AAFQ63_17990 [Cyanobacteria bacterium J06621_11]
MSRIISWIGVSIIGVLSFHATSTLLLAVLGVGPSSENWSRLLTLAGVLAVSGGAVGIQSYLYDRKSKFKLYHFRLYHTVSGVISGGASGAVVGFFTGGQLGEQAVSWAIAGLIFGSLILAVIAGWAYQRLSSLQAREEQTQKDRASSGSYFWASVCGGAIALISGLCAYSLAFGLGAWTLMALSVGRIALAGLLSLPTVLYLWFTRRALGLLVAYLNN